MALAPLRPASGSLSRILVAVLAGLPFSGACSDGSARSDGGPGRAAAQPLIQPGDDERVVLEIVSGQTPENSYWNFNGLHGGEGEILIPLGAEVEIDFRNADPAMAHSIGVTPWKDPFPANFAPIEPAFPGAMIPHAGSPDHATPPGGRSGFRFRASEVGDFAIVCFVPGHAAVGMFIPVRIVEGLDEARFEP